MNPKLARKARSQRSAALAAVAEGRWPLRMVLRDGHDALRTCPVHVVLMAAPGMGIQSTRKTLEQAKVWPLLPLGELTEIQRQLVADNLPSRAV